MPITLNDLTVNFSRLDRTTLLSEWRWLIGDRKFPVLLTALGDAFLHDVDSGEVHILSAGEAALDKVAESVEEFRGLLSSPDFVNEHFVPDVIVEMRAGGHELEPGQLYGYKVPPHLGGAYDAENLEPTDISVHFVLLGQLHRETRGLDPDTAVDSVQFK